MKACTTLKNSVQNSQTNTQGCNKQDSLQGTQSLGGKSLFSNIFLQVFLQDKMPKNSILSSYMKVKNVWGQIPKEKLQMKIFTELKSRQNCFSALLPNKVSQHWGMFLDVHGEH